MAREVCSILCFLSDTWYLIKVNLLEIMRDGMEWGEITGDGMAHGNHRMAHLINKKKSSELFLLHAPDLIMTTHCPLHPNIYSLILVFSGVYYNYVI